MTPLQLKVIGERAMTIDDLERLARDATVPGLENIISKRELADAVLRLVDVAKAARKVAEAVRATVETDIFETYCDVGAPDDCDHCHILSALAEYDAALAKSEGGG